MSEQQATITPSDSVSNAGSKNKRVRPGKAQRAAARGGYPTAPSTATGVGSISNASYFAEQRSYEPVPQPGKFPVVFPTGAGEPTQDVKFSLDPKVLSNFIFNIPKNYINSAKFAEFASNSGYSEAEFYKDVTRSTLLDFAQQVVHSHVNMQLPMGDYSSISSTDHYMMASVRSVVKQFGEFSVEPTGTRYVLADYDSTVKSLVRAASNIGKSTITTDNHMKWVVETSWVPTQVGDKRTAFIIASKLSKYVSEFGVVIPVEDLADEIFVSESTVFNAVKTLLPEEDRDRFDSLFTGYNSPQTFIAKMSADDYFIPKQLGLECGAGLQASYFCWDLSPKVEFPKIATDWARKRATVTKFFACESGLSVKTNATGSAAQLSVVTSSKGVTLVRTEMALSAPAFSLLACFPPSAVVGERVSFNVFMPTSIPVEVRAVEFAQRDWLG